jgi:hypothetical protein
MPAAPDPITSTPPVPGQPYDATSEASIGKWASVDPKSGPAGASGQSAGDFENGPGPWKQT